LHGKEPGIGERDRRRSLDGVDLDAVTIRR